MPCWRTPAQRCRRDLSRHHGKISGGASVLRKEGLYRAAESRAAQGFPDHGRRFEILCFESFVRTSRSSCPALPPPLKLRRANTGKPRRSLGGDGCRASTSLLRQTGKTWMAGTSPAMTKANNCRTVRSVGWAKRLVRRSQRAKAEACPPFQPTIPEKNGGRGAVRLCPPYRLTAPAAMMTSCQ